MIHGLDDTCIEEAWKHAETLEIEDLAAELLGKAQEARSIEDDLFCILYLAFRCGFKTAIGLQPDKHEMTKRSCEGEVR
jgi:hypothetical protein